MVVLITKWLSQLQSSEEQDTVPEPQCCLYSYHISTTGE